MVCVCVCVMGVLCEYACARVALVAGRLRRCSGCWRAALG